MGVIKEKFSLLTSAKVGKILAEELKSAFANSGLTDDQVQVLCIKVAHLARKAMGNQYVVMGGYSATDQLLDEARKLINQLDEDEKLVDLLEDTDNAATDEPSESELEDAYHAADSIKFVGSEKQIKWAKDIAINAREVIAVSKLAFAQLPTSAKWWIENRNDLYTALIGLKNAK